MLTLHFYSNTIKTRLETIEEGDEYSLDKIKEFEDIDPAWQETLNLLLQGTLIARYNISLSRTLFHTFWALIYCPKHFFFLIFFKFNDECLICLF